MISAILATWPSKLTSRYIPLSFFFLITEILIKLDSKSGGEEAKGRIKSINRQSTRRGKLLWASLSLSDERGTVRRGETDKEL